MKPETFDAGAARLELATLQVRQSAKSVALAKAELVEAVVDMWDAGGSLRMIAAAAGVSHQQVANMVAKVGRSGS